MDGLSHYESRTGSLSCTPSEVFGFVTDIRNFERFIPKDSVSNWQTGTDSCSFTVPMVGTVSARIIQKEPDRKVVYNGDALKMNDFEVSLFINEGKGGHAEVKVQLDADLNPMLRMVASKPIDNFLEVLVREMEKFNGWKDIIK